VTTVFDDTLLDDPVRLAEADITGYLRGAAMAGAQIRATSEAAAELQLTERLDLARPRALVVLARPGVSRSIAGLLAALLSRSCPVPVIVADLVPSWVGALDVVFAHSGDPGDHELAESLGLAARYGATVVLSGAEEGPVAAALAGKGLVLSPRVPVPPEFALAGGLAAGLLMANALGLLTVDMDLLADHLDAEAERSHLSRDSFANPAKALALRLAEKTPLLWGLDPLAEAVAEHGAFALATHAAMVCDTASFRQALSRRALYLAAVRNSGERDIFADPDADREDGSAGLALQVVLLEVASGSEYESIRYQAAERFPEVEMTSAVEEAESPDPIRAAVLALRFELAAVYLGLASGATGGVGHHTPNWM
jgi:hypothetical protein